MKVVKSSPIDCASASASSCSGSGIRYAAITFFAVGYGDRCDRLRGLICRSEGMLTSSMSVIGTAKRSEASSYQIVPFHLIDQRNTPLQQRAVLLLGCALG